MEAYRVSRAVNAPRNNVEGAPSARWLTYKRKAQRAKA